MKCSQTSGMMWGDHCIVMQGQELSDAVTEGLRSVNLLADKAGDKLVSSYRSSLCTTSLSLFQHCCCTELNPVCVVLSCPVLSCPVLSCPVLSCPVLSCPVLSCPVLSCPVLSCPVLSCPVLSCPVLSCPVLSCLPFPLLSPTVCSSCCFVNCTHEADSTERSVTCLRGCNSTDSSGQAV